MTNNIYKVKTPHGQDIRVRMYPRFNAQVIGFLEYGAKVIVEDTLDGWGCISHNDTKGWVYLRYMRKKRNWNIFSRKDRHNE